MSPERIRLIIMAGLVICSGLIVVNPVESGVLSVEAIFDDPADQRVEEESIDDTSHSQLILKIRHDDGVSLTGDFDLVQKLMQIERELLDGSNPDTSWDSSDVFISRLITPYGVWNDAFESRNRSLENATKWSDVLLPSLDEGWCGSGITDEEKNAFQSTLLMLPKDTNYGVACPSFSGASATQAPDTDELLWLVWLKNSDGKEGIVDWTNLVDWAEKVSENSEFEFSAAGVNMLFAKAKGIAEDDLKFVLLPSFFILAAVMAFILRDIQVAAVTLGGIGLIVCAEAGLLSTFGFSFSIIDGIAMPIILAVAVDGSFWYCKSSRSRDEVRHMLLMAMLTTLAAISLALFSPIKAQRSLALVMAIGIIFNWMFTRFVLEDFFLKRRLVMEKESKSSQLLSPNPNFSWSWPIALLVLASITVVSPSGVEVFDVQQFLPEDDSSLEELNDLQSKYVLAASTVAWVVVDVDGDSVEDRGRVLALQEQLGNHPGVISFETGIISTPLVLGLTVDDYGFENATIDSVSEFDSGSSFVGDVRLQRDGVTTGVAIAVMIDGQNADAALGFYEDVEQLLQSEDVSGQVGGDLVIGASLAKSFEDTRITQILAAGLAVFLVSFLVTNSTKRALRIAIGTIAIGASVDGMASIVGDRGVNTAPAVLLGMGFAADYLSHASAEHPPTRKDTFARWGAAITSVSVFILLSFAVFPPAKSTGQLLSLSILFSVLLATCLATTNRHKSTVDGEE